MIWVFGVVLASAVLADAVRLWVVYSFPPSERLVYREIETKRLHMHVFEPGVQAGTAAGRPAILFFFGGAWSLGTPAQFFPFCRYFAQRGFVAFSPEYRIRLRHGTGIGAALSDARAALDWVREHAAHYRIDASRIVLAGGSSGGHLAAAVAMIPIGAVPAPGPEPDASSAAVPAAAPPIAALVLFNPVTDLGGNADASCVWRLLLRLRSKQEREISPVDYVTAAAPPTVIFHSDSDGLVPIGQSQHFQAVMQAADNLCDLQIYRGRGRAFFNYGCGDFEEVAARASSFVQRLGLTSR